MIQKLKKIIINKNKSLFPYLYSLGLFLSGLEVVTYQGFVGEYLFLSLSIFVWLSFISMVLLVVFFRSGAYKNDDLLLESVLSLNKLITLPILITYYFLLGIESRHFSNFVFSTYHIQIRNFLPIIIINIATLILAATKEGKYINFLIKPIPKITLNIIFTAFLGVLFIVYQLKDLDELFNTTVIPFRKTLHSLKLTKEDRRRQQFGYLYDYANFIKNQTPPDATILIPPQEYPWPMTGNVLYFRYFLYPRHLVNGGMFEVGDKYTNGVKYVLLAKGEFKIENGYDYGWPKFNLKSKKIIYITNFGSDGNISTKEVIGPYINTELINKESWGLIFLEN